MNFNWTSVCVKIKHYHAVQASYTDIQHACLYNIVYIFNEFTLIITIWKH